MSPPTDIILPVHDALEYTRACVETLLHHTPSCRLLLVDDYSQPETTQYLQTVLQMHPQGLLMRTGKQKWFTRAANIGLRLARTDRVVLLNSDCVINDGNWLDELYGVWDEVTAQGARLGLVGSTFSEPEQRRWAEAREPGYVTGHCWLVSMEALTAIAVKRGQPGWYLNEMSQECIHIASDRIGCWELNRIGYVTVASFKSSVGHHGFKSWGPNLAQIGQLRLQDVD